MKHAFIIILALVFLVGCAPNEGTTGCALPQIQIGTSCCIDENANGICDTIETKAEVPEQPKEQMLESPKKKQMPEIPLRQLQIRINESFYPFDDSNFTDYERDNITGIQNNFNVTNVGRFYILQMKKPYHYLETQKNFSDFMQKLFAIEKRTWEMDGHQIIDANQIYSLSWQDVELVYEPSIEKVMIEGVPAYLVTHLMMFDLDGELEDFYWDFRMDVYCDEQYVVEVYPSNNFVFLVWYDSQISTNRDRFNEAVKEEKPRLVEAAKRVMNSCKGKENPSLVAPNEMIFLGRGGFYPPNITISKGEDLILHNQNREYFLGATFTFIREKPTRKVVVSDGIPHGNFTRVELTEPGEYKFFFEQYNAKGKVTVLP